MFTFRFESDTRTSKAGDIAFVVQAKSYRARREADGSVTVHLTGAEPVEHSVNGSLGGYDRCFVMNDDGKTIDRIRPTPMYVDANAAGGTMRPEREYEACADHAGMA